MKKMKKMKKRRKREEEMVNKRRREEEKKENEEELKKREEVDAIISLFTSESEEDITCLKRVNAPVVSSRVRNFEKEKLLDDVEQFNADTDDGVFCAEVCEELDAQINKAVGVTHQMRVVSQSTADEGSGGAGVHATVREEENPSDVFNDSGDQMCLFAMENVEADAADADDEDSDADPHDFFDRVS